MGDDMSGHLTITLDGETLFDRQVKEVEVEHDIHGNLSASAKYEPVTPNLATAS